MQILKIILISILYGIVQGITEWLPISSTGHMLLMDALLGFPLPGETEAFKELFFVFIQLGSILAVAVTFFYKLNPFSRKKSLEEKKNTLFLWLKVAVAEIPLVIIALKLDEFISAHLMNVSTVAITLIIYGSAFIFVEKRRQLKQSSEITVPHAAAIGFFQALSCIPGTSRSGSTILGGLLLGLDRSTSAEFSFFLAIPTMIGASLLKATRFIQKCGIALTAEQIIALTVSAITAFAVSLITIHFLMDFVRTRKLTVFGIYRIVLALVIIIFFIL
ncbi:MAG: undecaprenyl-diphosphate phosphatase [Clostridia bacterium]|nr:undecaprenyl-diphosphate phosphatase [Clostridia bacterium]